VGMKNYSISSQLSAISLSAVRTIP
jgi:hypothetical protein